MLFCSFHPASKSRSLHDLPLALGLARTYARALFSPGTLPAALGFRLSRRHGTSPLTLSSGLAMASLLGEARFPRLPPVTRVDTRHRRDSLYRPSLPRWPTITVVAISRSYSLFLSLSLSLSSFDSIFAGNRDSGNGFVSTARVLKCMEIVLEREITSGFFFFFFWLAGIRGTYKVEYLFREFVESVEIDFLEMKVHRFEVDWIATSWYFNPRFHPSNFIYPPLPNWSATDGKFMAYSEKVNGYVLTNEWIFSQYFIRSNVTIVCRIMIKGQSTVFDYSRNKLLAILTAYLSKMYIIYSKILKMHVRNYS